MAPSYLLGAHTSNGKGDCKEWEKGGDHPEKVFPQFKASKSEMFHCTMGKLKNGVKSSQL